MRIGSRGCLYVGHPSLALFSLIFNTRPGFFKYREENIVVMKDDGIISGLQPTKANIIEQINILTNKASGADHLAFYYTGHGGQLCARRKTEGDGLDEFIVPSDHQGYPYIEGTASPLDPTKVLKSDTKMWNKINGVITDNVLHRLLVDALPSGCTLNAIFDSCHSGTILDLGYNYLYQFPWEIQPGKIQGDQQDLPVGWLQVLEGKRRFRPSPTSLLGGSNIPPPSAIAARANRPLIQIPPSHSPWTPDPDSRAVLSPGGIKGRKGEAFCFSSNQDHEQAWVTPDQQTMTSIMCDIWGERSQRSQSEYWISDGEGIEEKNGIISRADMVLEAGSKMRKMKNGIVNTYNKHVERKKAGKPYMTFANPHQAPKVRKPRSISYSTKLLTSPVTSSGQADIPGVQTTLKLSSFFETPQVPPQTLHRLGLCIMLRAHIMDWTTCPIHIPFSVWKSSGATNETHLSPDDNGLRKEGNARKERVPTIRELPDYYIRKARVLRME
ncbi:hypothetical protein NLI96_g1116 [Meripilus lineatus]|uniref:Peptidase C14 caspase domain-containing protein n=1 Tax=Meripilus lineatus TaxID=2056292 RepID=A0AAD5YN86_9APHY|nr:hypothetical protein NLI96_g1116 [Physisporinus lineatus]